MHAVELRRIGRGQRHELLERDPPAPDAFGEQQRQARGDPRHAVGDRVKGASGPAASLPPSS
jgi:hypothetical protein